MAPPRLYPLPNEQLVASLAQARSRGLSFEQAWERAIRPRRATVMTNTRNAPEGAVRWPTDSSDRIDWIQAIYATKDEVRRAYERRPATCRERSVTLLLALIDGGDVRGMARAGHYALPHESPASNPAVHRGRGDSDRGGARRGAWRATGRVTGMLLLVIAPLRLLVVLIAAYLLVMLAVIVVLFHVWPAALVGVRLALRKVGV